MELRGILPRIFMPQPWPQVIQVLFYGWRQVEVDSSAEWRMPILTEITGHRRIEIMAYMDERAPDRDRLICERLYGKARQSSETLSA